jgi:hypothetical protein
MTMLVLRAGRVTGGNRQQILKLDEGDLSGAAISPKASSLTA